MSAERRQAGLGALRSSEAVFRWEGHRGLAPCGRGEHPLLAADSWLVANGRVRGLLLHKRRFLHACAETGAVRRGELNEFFRAALRALPRKGRVFPRVELLAGTPAVLQLRIRQAPTRGRSVRLWVSNASDPRTAPRRKGPDLSRLADVRRLARAEGAEEALLTTRSGLVLEGTTSSLLWWEGVSLCMPSAALRILPSVTVALIREIAARCRVPIAYRRRRVRDIHGLEAWLVNALHGIRPVSSWVGTRVLAGPPLRAPQFQSRLEAFAEPLPRDP